jgi:hypothetical protein
MVATAVPGMATAAAAPPTSATCSGGGWANPAHLDSGNYSGLTVSGLCVVTPGSHITIRGNVLLAPGSTLMAINSQTMNINGNIIVGRGATLGLGCSAGLGCDGQGGNPPPSQDTVHGNIIANNALAMYLNGDTVNGIVSFVGGGWGRDCTDPNADAPNDPLGHDLVIKDNTFRGIVNLQGWSGCWMGFIRNTVHGIVHIANNYANPANINNPGTDQVDQGLDSTEITQNVIWGVLSCSGNTPAAQFGDAAPMPNIVHGIVTGECAHMAPPTRN